MSDRGRAKLDPSTLILATGIPAETGTVVTIRTKSARQALPTLWALLEALECDARQLEVESLHDEGLQRIQVRVNAPAEVQPFLRSLPRHQLWRAMPAPESAVHDRRAGLVVRGTNSPHCLRPVLDSLMRNKLEIDSLTVGIVNEMEAQGQSSAGSSPRCREADLFRDSSKIEMVKTCRLKARGVLKYNREDEAWVCALAETLTRAGAGKGPAIEITPWA